MRGLDRETFRAQDVSEDSSCNPQVWGVAELNVTVERLGSGPYQLVVLVLGGGVYSAEGSLLLIMTIIAKNLISKWDMSPILAGTLATVIFIGLIMGTISGGFACDKYGRKLPILLTYLGIIVFLFVGIMSPGLLMLVGAKFMLGFCLGFGVPAANAIVCESCPPTQRSNIYCLTMVLFSLGQMYSAGVLWIMNPDLGHNDLWWRTMLAMTAMPPFVLLVFAYFLLQESPHWLIANGRPEDAQDVVRTMLRWQSNQMCLGNGADIKDLEECVNLHKPGLIRQTSNNALASPRPPGDREAGKGICGWPSMLGIDMWRVKMIFGEYFFSTTVIMCYVCFASNFAYYGMIYGLPSSLKTEAEAARAAAEELAKAEGVTKGLDNQWTPAGGVFMSAVFEIPGVFLAIVLAVTIGRRLNMALAFFCCASCATVVVYGMMTDQFDTWSIGAIFGVKLFIALGFIIVYLYLLEVYPTKIRGTGLAVCMVTGRLGAFLCPFMYDGMVLAGVHHSWFFLFMAVNLYIASILCYFLPYETKDAVLEEDLPPADRRTALLRSLSKQGSIPGAKLSPRSPARSPSRSEDGK